MRSIFKVKRNWLILFGILIAISIAVAIAHKLSKKHKDKIAQAADTTESIIIDKQLVAEKININVFHTAAPEKGLMIYIDGNSAISEANAKQFAGLSYYVAHIESKLLLSPSNGTANQCINIASQLRAITEELQKTYDIDSDELPILVGDKGGAELVYIALAQAEKDNFHAGISINFTLQTATKNNLCSINNFVTHNTEISPAKHLPASWYIFQNGKATADIPSNQFIAQISNAKLTVAENADSNSIAEAMQILQWLDPRLADQISSDNSNGNLPLIEVNADDNKEMPMAVLLTGDGGWAEIDKNLAQYLAEKGIPTVALDSLSYFWKVRTAKQTAKDIDDTIALYSEKWHKKKVILIGYSFGADVLPFVANALSDADKAKVTLVALLGMGKTAAFEFHLSSWMDSDTSADRLPTLPELKNMQWANSICIYGVEDDETACPQTSELGVKAISMSGDHHFDEKYDVLVQHIIENIKH